MYSLMVQQSHNTGSCQGIARAVAVLSVWACVQVLVLLGPPWTLLLLPVLVFLYVGLFITAHDAMHGSLAPGRLRVNEALGTVAAGLYAGFSYRHLKSRHLRHHVDPTGPTDPDHHRGSGPAWYLAFMGEYATVGQLIRAAAMFWCLRLVVPEPRVLVAWALPAVLSSVQLFYFGIWRVHHDPPGGWGDDPLKARSETFSPWWSFLTCWHFGHHREHHAHPHLAWWELPRAPRVPARG